MKRLDSRVAIRSPAIFQWVIRKYYSNRAFLTDDLEVDDLECVDRRVMDLRYACKFHMARMCERS